MLKINSVTISNFCQHEHLRLDLPVGLIGLVGPNGSGKSNIVNALRGALTGVFKRHTGDTAAGCIQQGGMENAVIVLEGTLAKNRFCIQREITPKTIKHRLTLNGELYTEKSSEMEEWLTETSGLTPALMSEFMFIGQQELYSFLDATDTERSKKFMALCGTKVYERIREEYNDMLKTDKAKFETVNETIMEQLKQQLVLQQNNLDEISLAYEEAAKERRALGSQAKWEQTLAADLAALQQLDKLDQLDKRLRQEEERMRTMREEISQREKTIRGLSQRQQAMVQARQGLTAGFDSVADALEYYAEAKRLADDAYTLQLLANEQKELRFKANGAHQKAAEQLKALQPVDRLSDTDFQQSSERLHSQVAEKQKSQAVDRNEIASLQKLLNALDSLGKDVGHTCPLCQAEKEHWQISLETVQGQRQLLESAIVEKQQEIDHLGVMLRQLRQRKEKCDKLTQDAQDREADYHKACKVLTETKDKLQMYQEALNIYEEGDVEKHAKILEALEAEKSVNAELNPLQAVQEQASKLLSSLEEHAAVLKEERKQLVAEARVTVGKTAGAVEACRAELELLVQSSRTQIGHIQKAAEKLCRLEGSKEEAVQALSELDRRLTAAESQMAKSGDVQQWHEYMEKALSWMRKDGLPKIVHANILRQICSVVNEEITFFGSPFQVSVDDGEGLSFIAHFDDERAIPAKALSGGQKTILSLSLYNSIHRIFGANSLGVLVIDEAGSELDSENASYLYALLRQYREHLHLQGKQCIWVTHDERVEEACDSVIRL